MASAITLLAMPLASQAASFTFDGVKDGVGGADMYTTTFSANWWNGHDQDNFPKDGSQPNVNVHYGTGSDGGSGNFSWLLIEAPLYAKNMVWGDLAEPFEDEYGKVLDFSGATGSEGVLFGASDLGDGKDKDTNGATWLDLAKDDFNDNSPWQVIDYKDSVEYLLGAGSGECLSMNPGENCGAEDRTMSFEIKLAALDNNGFQQLKSAIETNGVAFHLSPDRNGTPPPPDMPEVPVPAAFWLFGTALIGFIGYSRRRNLG